MQAVIVGHAAIRASNRAVYRALLRRGIDVSVVVPTSWKTTLGPLRVEPEPPDSGLPVISLPKLGASHSNCYWFARGLEQLIADRAERCAVYVDEDPAGLAAAQAATAARRAGCGLVVLGIQNVFKRYPPPFGALQRRVFRIAGAAVATSRQAAQTLRRRGFRGHTSFMPFSTELTPLDAATRARLRAGLGERFVASPLVGYAGRLVWEKGVDIFLQAVAKLDDVCAVVVGDGPERVALASLAVRLGIDDRVRFLGAVSPEEAATSIGMLDVLVLPSRTTPSWAEQFGRVVIEAMASEVCVVASDTGAIPEVIGDAGLLVPEGNPEAFAEAIAHVLRPKPAGEYHRKGRERTALLYSVDAAANALYEALSIASGEDP